jgi:hypothetical protein
LAGVRQLKVYTAVRVTRGLSDGSFVKEQPCLEHANRYDGDRRQARAASRRSVQGPADFADSIRGGFTLRVSVDEERLTGEKLNSLYNALFQRGWRRGQPPKISARTVCYAFASRGHQRPIYDWDEIGVGRTIADECVIQVATSVPD